MGVIAPQTCQLLDASPASGLYTVRRSTGAKVWPSSLSYGAPVRRDPAVIVRESLSAMGPRHIGVGRSLSNFRTEDSECWLPLLLHREGTWRAEAESFWASSHA